MRKFYNKFLRTIWLVVCLLGATSVHAATGDGLVINEIQVANVDMFIDPSYNYGGWIELYNPTATGIRLSSLYISDDPLLLKKWRLASDMGTIASGGFKVIWFDHYEASNKEYSPKAYQQVDFKLNYDGGEIIISDGTNIIVRQSYPAAVSRTSYARKTDGGSVWSLTSIPTPGASNNSSPFALNSLPEPQVDREGALFTEPFEVNVEIPEGTTLKYTTDGTAPAEGNGEVSLDGRFEIDHSSVYRFRLFREGYLPSPVVTRSYLQRTSEYYLPVISVVTNPDNLFDNTIGAYVDGTNGVDGRNKSSSNKNRGWERPVNFEYMVPDESGEHITVLNQEVDFQVCGGWSRHFDSKSSSFKLKANKSHAGLNSMDYSFFGEKPFFKTKALQIRNGGNDNLGENGRIRDAALHEIIRRSGFYVDCQSWQPAHIFINGVYHRSFNIREPNNKHYAYSTYGIDTEEVDAFESDKFMAGDDVAFTEWMNLASQLASKPDDESLYQQICDLVDVDEYFNYMAAEHFMASDDWLTNYNNIKGFRDRNNGKFHLMLMDVDQAFRISNMFTELNKSNYDGRRLVRLFYNMLKCDKFKKRFIDAFSIVVGSVFEPNRSEAIVREMADLMAGGLSLDGMSPWSSANFIINNVRNRRQSSLDNMMSFLGIPDNDAYTVKLSSNISGAALQLNGQEIPTGKFDGRMFAPITLTAQAPMGCKFVVWQVDGARNILNTETVFDYGSSWRYYDEGSLDGVDWKASSYTMPAWKSGLAGFGYGKVGKNGSADYTTTISYGSSSSNKRPTYYFRKTFTLDELPDSHDAYVLDCYVDDGYVIYLNGKEISRYNLPSGDITYYQYTTTYAGATALHNSITIDGALLQKGTNVIAVEVHNTSATSSDIYWDAMLRKETTSNEEFSCTTETLPLSEMLAGNASYTITAMYEPLEDKGGMAVVNAPVRVNEVSAANEINVSDYFKKDDWIELYNTTDEPVDVAGMYLTDDEAQPQKFQIPSNDQQPTVIEPKGHLIVWASKRANIGEQIHANFKLSNADGQMVMLTSGDGSWSDKLAYVQHGGKESVGLYPSGGSQVFMLSRPSIAKDNAMTFYSRYLYEIEQPDVPETEHDKFELALSEGWNWISHPLSRNISTDELTSPAFRILSQNGEVVKDDVLGWTGNLSSLSPTAGYKIEMMCDYEKQFDGPFFAEGNTIQLHKGWNWIGYPVMGSQDIETALSRFKPSEGDIMVGQYGFATYEKGSWSGDLEMLNTGSGYLYKSGVPKTLVYNPYDDKAVKKVKPRFHKQPMNAWTACATRHPNVMGVVAKIVVDGMEAEDGAYSVGAFSQDGECRGVGKYIDGHIFITIYGDAKEQITFRVADAEMGVVYDVTESLDFCSDVIGCRQSPFELHVGDATDIVSVQSSMALASVTYYNLDGIPAGHDQKALRSGVYVARMQLLDGRQLNRKVIVK